MLALAAVLQIAGAAVLAANPELLTQRPIDRRDDLPEQVWIADAIVTEAREMRELLDAYREALRAGDVTGHRDPDDDVPI